MQPTIMLVDDSRALRMQAREILRGAGFEILEACDGIDALEKLATAGPISLIVCDVTMPRMTGLEFIEQLAKSPELQHPPIVMMTTEGHPEMIARAKASGARGWMVKPFKADLLLAAAKQIIGR